MSLTSEMTGNFRIGEWEVEPGLNRLTGASGSVRIEPKVMEVLVALAKRPSEVISKEELIAAVWVDTFVTDDVLLRSISELRKALGDDAKEPRFIETISKRGYRLMVKVRPSGQETPKRGVRRRVIWLGGATAAAAAAAAIWLGHGGREKLRTPVLVAVLPFVNFDRAPEQEFFSDGLTEEMITQLSLVAPEELKVMARTSTMQFKGEKRSVKQIASELKANYVLEGSVRQEGSRVRITAQLIETKGQTHLWSSSYDRELSGILGVQEEVARAIARELRLRLARPSAERTGGRQVNPEAYTAMLKGRHYWHQLTLTSLERATEEFRRATELDPQMAEGWLGLGDSYRMRGAWWGLMRPHEAYPLAKAALEKALALNPRLAEAYAGLGWVRLVYDWDWAGAERDFRRAIELGPNSIQAHSPFAHFLRTQGRFEEARREIERCLELDPLAPLELGEAATLYLVLKQPEKSELYMRRAMEMAPATPSGVWAAALVEGSRKRYGEALALLEKLPPEGRNPMVLKLMANLYSAEGRKDRVRQILAEALAAPYPKPSVLATIYLLLDDEREAVKWLQQAARDRDPMWIWMRGVGPGHRLWKYPEIRELVDSMHFAAPPPGP